ncbi:kynurenine-oxoglutarate transaminase, putative [Ichthyophthirius multifiliis]|uniref:Kynurenine-oxoglutarate transaminase, putative n=1 Tax=Ichthyophthirius multifiliis TaxID=5932 RepID=G0R3S9_ICHMU|nr:kynurenine-oxoglutarate transaminase, putative [Ichthyophthirius multifiliis]EGR27896.1 kynurenine-oxoglutarate transaminase, putative [Ichthyophthirius multifiliis]|eukprot:XP_004027241.1 kynurenine-oxoglutarate transaminase, putative [Ichthyophthirius multifiliis]
MEKINSLIQKYPQLIIVEDGVYEHLCFEHLPLKLPRFANLPNTWNRTISVYSAGKLFSATGIRVGWAIGPQNLIKYVQSFHQYSVFCQHGPMQDAVSEALDTSISKGNYFNDTQQLLIKQRDLLIDQLTKSKIPLNIWVPQGGYFVIADISNVQVNKKYFQDEKNGQEYSKDYAFSLWLCKEKGVTSIPCSSFYPSESKKDGENLVRFAFCKTNDQILEAGKRLQ